MAASVEARISLIKLEFSSCLYADSPINLFKVSSIDCLRSCDTCSRLEPIQTNAYIHSTAVNTNSLTLVRQSPINGPVPPFQQFQTATISSNNAKFPYSREGTKYEIWAMKMEYWNTECWGWCHNLWRIVHNGEQSKEVGKDANGHTIVKTAIMIINSSNDGFWDGIMVVKSCAAPIISAIIGTVGSLAQDPTNLLSAEYMLLISFSDFWFVLITLMDMCSEFFVAEIMTKIKIDL
ncbi:hypothetical protein Tco_0567894 [Tanacetum coccineum]